MEIMIKEIHGGIYLVITPSLSIDEALPKLQQAIRGGIDIIQIPGNWPLSDNKTELIDEVCTMAHAAGIPVLINEEWEMLKYTKLDGVHFDGQPEDISGIRISIGKPFICGITCGNDLSAVTYASANGFDYISFCSMFPSPSAGVCEIVSQESVRRARQITSMPIFAAGGITQDNMAGLAGTGIDGIAAISAIMNADDITATTKNVKEKLAAIKEIYNENNTGR